MTLLLLSACVLFVTCAVSTFLPMTADSSVAVRTLISFVGVMTVVAVAVGMVITLS